MIDKIQTYFSTLEGLSTDELDQSMEKLVREEKRNVALVIMHIAEMSRRKGHLERGYKNLFDYCTRKLHLSEGSVARRIQVANVSRRFPQIIAALAENRMSLTVAGLLSPVLTEENVEKVLTDCADMTRREVEEYLVTIRPKPVFEPLIRKLPSPRATPPIPQAAAPPKPTPRPVPHVSPSILEPARPEQFNFRFTANRQFKEKLERLAEVLGVHNPQQNMAEIMEQALDIALDKKDVKRKLARRLARKSKSLTGSGMTVPQGTNCSPESGISKREQPLSRPGSKVGEAGNTPPPMAKQSCPGKISPQNRYLSSQKRERVHDRASYQCEYRGPDGTRCRARTGLEIEHLLPFAIHRSHDEKHLRLYCGPHNRLGAEKVFGRAFIQEKIHGARQEGRSNGVNSP